MDIVDLALGGRPRTSPPACVAWRVGSRYGNTVPESTIAPQSWTKYLAAGQRQETK